jgi:hypothetical protein
MCKAMPVIPVNKVVDPKRIIGKKWRAKEEERHKGLLTPKKLRQGLYACTVFRYQPILRCRTLYQFVIWVHQEPILTIVSYNAMRSRVRFEHKIFYSSLKKSSSLHTYLQLKAALFL